MIKIRLHGTAQEIREATEVINTVFKVLSQSDLYSDRGRSLYSRCYIEADIKDIPTLRQNIKELLDISLPINEVKYLRIIGNLKEGGIL